jgi:hypothetical protein
MGKHSLKRTLAHGDEIAAGNKRRWRDGGYDEAKVGRQPDPTAAQPASLAEVDAALLDVLSCRPNPDGEAMVSFSIEARARCLFLWRTRFTSMQRARFAPYHSDLLRQTVLDNPPERALYGYAQGWPDKDAALAVCLWRRGGGRSDGRGGNGGNGST